MSIRSFADTLWGPGRSDAVGDLIDCADGVLKTTLFLAQVFFEAAQDYHDQIHGAVFEEPKPSSIRSSTLDSTPRKSNLKSGTSSGKKEVKWTELAEQRSFKEHDAFNVLSEPKEVKISSEEPSSDCFKVVVRADQKSVRRPDHGPQTVRLERKTSDEKQKGHTEEIIKMMHRGANVDSAVYTTRRGSSKTKQVLEESKGRFLEMKTEKTPNESSKKTAKKSLKARVGRLFKRIRRYLRPASHL